MHLENPKLKDCYIKVGDINTHYWDAGVGNIPLILVHGINSSVAFWEKNICELAKNYRVIALDLVGFGDTDKPNITYDLDTIVNFLKDFLDKLDIKRCYLVGHSMGGAVGIKFAITYNNYVEKLVLVSPAGFYRKVPLIIRLLIMPFLGKKLLQINKKIIGRVMRFVVYDKQCFSDEFIENNYRIVNLPGAQEALGSFLQANLNFSGIRKNIISIIEKELHKLRMPILIIWGKNDKVLSVCGAFRAKKILPAAKLHLFDKCGHVPQLEYAEEFNRIVNEFLI